MFYAKFCCNWFYRRISSLYLRPLEKRRALHLNKRSPFTHWCVVRSLVEIGSMVLKKKTKMWKVYNNEEDGQISNIKTRVYGFDPYFIISPALQKIHVFRSRTLFNVMKRSIGVCLFKCGRIDLYEESSVLK